MLDTHHIPVFQSIRPSAHNLVVDSGKGETREAALLATMAEAVERYCGENCRNASVPYKDLTSKESVVTYPQLPFMSPFADDLPMMAVHRYPDMATFYAPREIISYGRTNPRAGLFRYPWGTSGLGAHTTLESAILSGLMELMERDAVSQFANGSASIEVRRIATASVPQPLQVIADKIVQAPYELIILELRGRIEQSVFTVFHTDSYLYPGGIGFGAHPCRRTGLKHALIEAAQSRVLRIAGSRDDLRFLVEDPYSVEQLKDLPEEPFGEDSDDDDRDLSDADHLKTCMELLGAIRADVYFCELEVDPKPPLRVVKVIAPTLGLLRQGSALTGIPLAPSMDVYE